MDEAQTQIKQIPWADSIDSLVKISAGNDKDIIKAQVMAGHSQLWKCTYQDKCAFIVTRIDRDELVIVLFEGSGIVAFMPFFIQRADELNLSIRAHIKRKGLIRIGQKLGFQLDHYIMRRSHG